MTQVYLIRHCEAEGNKLGRCQGGYDSDITLNGAEQIVALAKRFEGIKLDAVYASDLYRARKTAEPLAQQNGLRTVLLPSLREMHMGRWEDCGWGVIARDYPGCDRLFAERIQDVDHRSSGGESFLGVVRRVTEEITFLAEKNDGKSIAIVFHGTATRAFLAKIMGFHGTEMSKTPHPGNTAVTKLSYDNGFTLEYFGDNSHLSRAQMDASKQKWHREGKLWHEVHMWFQHDAAPEGYIPLKENDSVYRCYLADTYCGYFVLNHGEEGYNTLSYAYLEQKERGHGYFLQMLGEACGISRSEGKRVLRVKKQEGLRPLDRLGFIQVGGENMFEKPLYCASII